MSGSVSAGHAVQTGSTNVTVEPIRDSTRLYCCGAPLGADEVVGPEEGPSPASAADPVGQGLRD
jgi:hypothetical protein